jgi:MFS family permease
MNNFFGRRGTIFIMCILAAVTSIWEAVSNSWINLFIARFFLGISIGVKSTTVPIYTAESSPPAIRGALTMLWQTFTAFGIMLGYIMDVAFVNVRPGTYLNWRLMLGSTCVAPVLVCCMVWFGPESPRWYMKKNRCSKAFECLLRLRRTPLLAARDLYYMYVNLRVEKKMKADRNLMKEMFTVPRNRRAAQSSFLVMFMQQFCGVNVIMYYSSVIFVSAGFSVNSAILASLGARVPDCFWYWGGGGEIVPESRQKIFFHKHLFLEKFYKKLPSFSKNLVTGGGGGSFAKVPLLPSGFF